MCECARLMKGTDTSDEQNMPDKPQLHACKRACEDTPQIMGGLWE